MSQLLKRIIRAEIPNVILQDLHIHLKRKGDSIDLLGRDANDKPLRSFEEVCDSQPLDNLIQQGYLTLWDENGLQLTGTEALRATNLATLVDSGSGEGTEKTITKDNHGFSVGTVLRYDAVSGYTEALADSEENAEVVGIVSVVVGVNSFTLLNVGYIDGLSDLVEEETYFLSDTVLGALTVDRVDTEGYVIKPLLNAISSTSGYFFNFRGTLISASESINIDGGRADHPPTINIDGGRSDSIYTYAMQYIDGGNAESP